MKTQAKKLLSGLFGCAGFRVPQLEVIENILAGKNTLCLMPTGAGKSLCYQISGVLLGKTTIVLSPLRALAAQQAAFLKEKGLKVVAIDAGMTVKEQFQTLRQILKDAPQFLFLSVERAANDGFLEHVLRCVRRQIGLVVLDEAHCVSQWGHNFRPAYKAVPDFLGRVFLQEKRPPILCLTATLNTRDRDEICGDFGIQPESVFQSQSLYRDNLKLQSEVFENETAKETRLEQLLHEYRGQKVLVYVHRKKSKHGTSALDERFKARGFNCGFFDADLDTEERTRVLEQFLKGEVETVFATGAFGMGIHIPDIRAVIHYLLPESIEQYYQEVGRAGRDGKPAFCHLLFTETNIRVRRDLISAGFPSGDDLRAFFDESLIFQGDDIADLDPLRSLNDENLLAFHLLQKAGVISVVCRGIARVKDFGATKTTSPSVQRCLDASTTGLIRSVGKKTGVPVSEVTQMIFDAYCRNEVAIKTSPTKTLFIHKNSDIDDATLATILSGIDEKKSYRLKGLDALVSLIKSSEPMSVGVRAHLGI